MASSSGLLRLVSNSWKQFLVSRGTSLIARAAAATRALTVDSSSRSDPHAFTVARYAHRVCPMTRTFNTTQQPRKLRRPGFDRACAADPRPPPDLLHGRAPPP